MLLSRRHGTSALTRYRDIPRGYGAKTTSRPYRYRALFLIHSEQVYHLTQGRRVPVYLQPVAS